MNIFPFAAQNDIDWAAYPCPGCTPQQFAIEIEKALDQRLRMKGEAPFKSRLKQIATLHAGNPKEEWCVVYDLSVWNALAKQLPLVKGHLYDSGFAKEDIDRYVSAFREGETLMVVSRIIRIHKGACS